MSRVWELRQGGGAQRTVEYVGLLDGWLDSESATVRLASIAVGDHWSF